MSNSGRLCPDSYELRRLQKLGRLQNELQNSYDLVACQICIGLAAASFVHNLFTKI
jgi:hypothetical protein